MKSIKMESLKNTSTGIALTSAAISAGTIFYVNSQINSLREDQERSDTAVRNILENISGLRDIPQQVQQLPIINDIKKSNISQHRLIKQLQQQVRDQQAQLKLHEKWFKEIQETMTKNGTPIELKKKRKKKPEISESEDNSDSDSSESESVTVRRKTRSGNRDRKGRRTHRDRKDRREKRRAHFMEDEDDSEIAELSG